MKKSLITAGALGALVTSLFTPPAEAAQKLRVQVDQRGDFVMIGTKNSFADCERLPVVRSGIGYPVVRALSSHRRFHLMKSRGLPS